MMQVLELLQLEKRHVLGQKDLNYIHCVLVLVLLSILSKRQGLIKGQACKHTPLHIYINAYKLHNYNKTKTK